MRIERVLRPQAQRSAALLRWLQLETLPHDEPLPTDKGWWWVAYQDDQPAAFAALCRSVRWRDTGYLCRAGVLRAYRGAGLQKRLIRVRERWARRMGLRWLVTDTFDNPASANSLIACGFRMFTPSAPWAAEGACYWRKRILED